MGEVLIKTLDFLCQAEMEGVGPVSGMSVLCSVKSSKEQVFRALKFLTTASPNPHAQYDAPVSKFACPASVPRPTLADDECEVTDLLWAMDRLHMLYKLAQAAAV